MGSFKRAVYKVGIIEEEEKQISCNDTLQVDGREGIYEVEITIGTEVGRTGLNYEALNVPDRFQLFFDGNLVADSKYVGDSLDSYVSRLIDTKELSVMEYSDGKFVDTGRTETITINQGDIPTGGVGEPKEGKGTLYFQKEKATVTTMKLRVIGALGGTIWNAAPICPHEYNTTSQVTNVTSREYIMAHFRYIPNMACEDFDQGTYEPFYSSEGISVGDKIYYDSQLTKPVKSGYLYLGRTIREVEEGKIVDLYPCHKGLGI